MMSRQELLRGLSRCVRLMSVAPIHWRHHRKTIVQYGLTEAQQAEAVGILDGLINHARRYSALLLSVRESVVKEEKRVY